MQNSRAEDLVKAGVEQGARMWLESVYLRMALERIADAPETLFLALGEAEPSLGPYLRHQGADEEHWRSLTGSVERFAQINRLQQTAQIASHSPTCPYFASPRMELTGIPENSETCHDVCFVHWFRAARLRLTDRVDPIPSESVAQIAFPAFERLISSCNELMARYPG